MHRIRLINIVAQYALDNDVKISECVALCNTDEDGAIYCMICHNTIVDCHDDEIRIPGRKPLTYANGWPSGRMPSFMLQIQNSFNI
jgi:hypothetical protein